MYQKDSVGSTARTIHPGIISIGEWAWQVLHEKGWQGQVIAVTSTCIYIRGINNTFIWVGPGEMVRHPCALLATTVPVGVISGEPVWVKGDLLYIGPAFTLTLLIGALWRSPELYQLSLAEGEQKTRCLTKLSQVLSTHMAPGGFGQLLPEIPRLAAGLATQGNNNPLANYGRTLLRDLGSACRYRDSDAALSAAGNLIGFGPGLTPSGDDFLGGFFFVSHLACASEIGVGHWIETWRPQLLARAETLTNAVSYGILLALARGRAPEPLYEFLNSGFLNENKVSMLTACKEMILIGSSTGWDLLAGAIFGAILNMAPAMTIRRVD